MYMYICICTYIYIYVYIHACMHVCMCVCVYIYIYICIYTNPNTYKCICVCICISLYIYIYICIYTHTICIQCTTSLLTGVCETHTPPRKKQLGKPSFRSAKSGFGEPFLLQDHMPPGLLINQAVGSVPSYVCHGVSGGSAFSALFGNLLLTNNSAACLRVCDLCKS